MYKHNKHLKTISLFEGLEVGKGKIHDNPIVVGRKNPLCGELLVQRSVEHWLHPEGTQPMHHVQLKSGICII